MKLHVQNQHYTSTIVFEILNVLIASLSMPGHGKPHSRKI